MGDILDAEAAPGSTFTFHAEASLTGWASLFGEIDNATIQRALENSGYFYDVNVEKLTGYINPYVKITGGVNTWIDSGRDVQQTVINVLSSVGLIINRIDYFGFTPIEGTEIPPGQPIGEIKRPQDVSGQQCDFSKQSFSQYLACQFGTGGIAIGTVALLVAGFLIVRRL